MTFRDEGDAARARAEALERRVAEVEAENERLRAARAVASAPATLQRSRVLQRPSTWLWVTAALMGVAGLIELDGGRPPWDEILPVIGMASIASVGMSLLMLRTVAGPTELMILSGRRHRGPDGRDLGYRVVQPGVGVFRVPILERIDRMDLRSIPVDLEVRDSFTKDGKVTLRGNATVAITTSPERVARVIERFLGRPPGDIATVARQTLESATRATLAQLMVAELEPEREKLTQHIRALAEEDLENLGLEVQTLTLGTIESR